MIAAVCPYCRDAVDLEADGGLVCSGCGTPHHADCYAENGGCTVFGCTAAPTEEPKLRLSGGEVSGEALDSANMETAPAAPSPVVVRTPPPPRPVPQREPEPFFISGSILFGSSPPSPAPVAAAPLTVEFGADPTGQGGKNRTTFIVLGVLLGCFGAHNFFGGYRRRAFWQLGISLLSFGLAIPMMWVWAVVDVCTIDRDSNGVKFVS